MDQGSIRVSANLRKRTLSPYPPQPAHCGQRSSVSRSRMGQRSSQPLILLLLDKLIHLVIFTLGVIHRLSWAPVAVYLRLTARLMTHQCFDAPLKPKMYVLLAFPRWIVSICGLLIFLFTAFTPLWFAGQHVSKWGLIIPALLWIVCLKEGQRLWEASGRAQNAKVSVYIVGAWQAQLDMVVFIAALFCTVGILRLPALVEGYHALVVNNHFGISKTKKDEFRRLIFAEFLRTLLDWVMMPIFLLLAVLPWRVRDLWRLSRTLPYLEVRTAAVRFAISSIMDIPFFLMAAVPIVSVYRIPHFHRQWTAAGSEPCKWQERREACIHQFTETIVDMFFLMVALLSLYRFPIVLQEQSLDGFRQTAAIAVLRTSCDIVCVLLVLVLLLPTIYRMSNVLHALQSIGSNLFTCSKDVAVYKSVARNAFCVILDIPFFVAGLAVLVIGWWRAPEMLRRLHRASPDNKASECADAFWNICLDWPFVFLSAVTILAPWRLGQLLAKICQLDSPELQRRHCFSKAVQTVSDITGLFCGVFVTVIAVWRAPSMLYNVFNALRGRDLDACAGVCRHALYEAILDAPFAVCAAVVMVFEWRAPWLVLQLSNGLIRGQSTSEQRRLCLQQAVLTLVDVPCILCTIVLIATGYRLRVVCDGIQGVSSPCDTCRSQSLGKFHSVIFAQFRELLTDLPYFACFMVCLLFPWRLANLWQKLVQASDAKVRRHILWDSMCNGFVDVPYVICGCCCVFFPWRIQDLWKSLKTATSVRQKRDAAIETLCMAVWDVVAIAAWSFVTVTVWRASRMHQDIQHIVRASNAVKIQVVHGDSNSECPRSVFRKDSYLEWRDTTPKNWHGAAIFHAVSMLNPLELFCMVIAPLSLWRLPRLCRTLGSDDCESDAKWRIAACRHFCLALTDVIAFWALLPLTVTGWRLPALKTALERCNLVEAHEQHDFQRHYAIFRQLIFLLCDIPLAFLFLASCLFFWRVPAMIRILRTGDTHKHWFSTILQSICRGCLDVPCGVLVIVLFCTWRKSTATGLLAKLCSDHRNPHSEIIAESVAFLVDIPFILLSPLTLWRLARVWRAAFPARLLNGGASILGDPIVKLEVPDKKTRTGSGEMDGHGFVLHLYGEKPADLIFRRATLSIGDEFLSSICDAGVAPRSAISAFKMTMHPIQLCDTMLDSADFKKSSTRVDTQVHIGTGERGGVKISHRTLLGTMLKLMNAGDSACIVTLECSCLGTPPNGGCQARLVRISMHPSDLLAAQNGTLQPLEVHYVEASESSSTSSGASTLRVLVLREFTSVFLDVISTVLLVLSAVVPWRMPEVVTVIFSGDLWQPSLKCLRATLCNLPLELAVLSATILTPWHLRLVSRTLIQSHSPQRTSILRETLQESLQDLAGIFLTIVACATPWRLPHLLLDFGLILTDRQVWFPSYLENFRQPQSAQIWKRSRRDLALVATKQCGLLLVDLVTVLECCFIALSLISLPHFLVRFWQYYVFTVKQDGGVLYVQLWRRWVTFIRPLQQPRQGLNDERNGPLLKSRPVCRFVLLRMLEANDLCHLAATNCQWKKEADSEELWVELYRNRWPALVPRDLTLTNAKKTYAKRHLAEQPQPEKSLAELDYVHGWRHVVQEEFFRAVYLSPHALLLPLKILGYLCSPIYWLATAYHCQVKVQVARPQIGTSVGGRLQKAFLSTMVGEFVIFFHEHASAHLDFWRRERFFAWSIPLAFSILINELACAIALLNGVAVIAMTFLGPLWMHKRRFRFLGRVVVGVALPFIVFLQFVILVGPYRSFLSNQLPHAVKHMSITAANIVEIDFVKSSITLLSSWWPLQKILLFIVAHGSTYSEFMKVHLAPVFSLLALCFAIFDGVLQYLLTSMPILWTLCAPLLRRLGMAFEAPLVSHVIWAMVVSVSLRKTYDLLSTLYPDLKPLWLYRATWRAFCQFVGIVSKGSVRVFDMTLKMPTRFCRYAGMIGDVLLVPITVLWMGFPLLLAWRMQATNVMYLFALISTLNLIIRGRRLIKEAWNEV